MNQRGMLILLNPFSLCSTFYFLATPSSCYLDFRQLAVYSICCFHNPITSFPLSIIAKV